jgi:chemotaxis protein methyltransferase CheR
MAMDNTLARHEPVPAEDLSDPVWIRIHDLIYGVSGIYQYEKAFHLFSSRCKRRMQAIGARTPREYLDYLTVRPNRDAEIRNLLNEITIGETCFFRNPQQIDALRKVVIPRLVSEKKKASLTHLRFWSAGCSTGEDPYTLAMLLLEEQQAALKGWTFEVLATDLNDRSLAKAQEAIYTENAVRNVPPEILKKYFNTAGPHFRVADSVRVPVSFARLNLLDDSKMLFMRAFDVVFCCNVLIYFDGRSKTRTVQHFYNCLLADRYFFLGHSESLFGVNDQFRLVHFPGTTGYWKPPIPVTRGGLT